MKETQSVLSLAGSGEDSDRREYESVVPLAPAMYPYLKKGFSTDFL